MVKLIFAMGSMGEFGYSGKLPWPSNTEDMKHFKKYTDNCVVVMGRSTWESLPCPLYNRTTVVLTSMKENISSSIWRAGVPDEVITDTPQGLATLCQELSERHDKDVCIIGGKQLVEHGLHFANEVSVTTMTNPTGETYPHDVEVSTTLVKHFLGGLTPAIKEGDSECLIEVFKGVN